LDTLRPTLRVDFGSGHPRPRKGSSLEAVARTGSMSEAGRKLGMSYRAWLLVDDMNNRFRDPVTAAQPSGAHDVARHSPRLGKN
jgi:molybdate transport system regulatory protein